MSDLYGTIANNSVFKAFERQKNLLVVMGVVAIVLIMILPVPAWTVDILLAINISASLIILLASMYNEDALSFSVFPPLLLAVTLFRLSLNIATTRLILSEGDAGKVIEVFGTFVTGNNAVVGFIIFVIIVIIQFAVITKGSGRIAEVAARFTLDAMPGKQMAIDADLNAGMINEAQARERREKIRREADFYGAMDGASKFVKGDSIAGILITLINVGAGFIIGILQKDLTLMESLSIYTTLTIGDGLVSQIPALMISTSAGFIVSRAATSGSLGAEMTSQLFANTAVMVAGSVIMLILGFIPGLPKIPFFVIAAILGGLAYFKFQQGKIEDEVGLEKPLLGDGKEDDEPTEEAIESYLHIDPLELEIGYGLIPLVDASQGGDLLDRISQIRKQLAADMGFIIPPVRIRDNIQLQANEYAIKIRRITAGAGELMSGSFLAMNPGTATEQIRGIETVEPAFGLPAVWITESQKEHADMAGYTVVELPAVLATHLTEVIKKHAHDIITRQDVQDLVNNVKESNQTVVEELIPGILSIGDVHKILQNLLREKVSIRDLPIILETLSDIAPKNKNHDILSEYVRNALATQICEEYRNEENVIPVLTIDPNLEAKMEGAVEESETGFRFNLSPAEAGRIIEASGVQIEGMKQMGELPIVLCSPVIRSQYRRLLEANFPEVVVLSYNEIIPGVEIRSVDMVTLEIHENNG